MRNRFQVALSAVLLIAGISLIACSGKKKQASSAAPPAAVVEVTDSLKFVPRQVTIKAGETVKWENASVLVNTVTCDSTLAGKPADVALPPGAKPFDSGNIDPNGTFEYTFTVPGTYKYFCIPHEATGMLGEVIVQK